MSVIWRKAWHCDECEHVWLQTDTASPERCPNRSCRSRNWNHDRQASDVPYDAKTTAPQLVAAIPNVTLASQLPPVAAYQRPKHDPTCRCLMCRPPSK
jgi:hypothetical protein